VRGYAILSRHQFFIIQNFEQLALALKNRVVLNFFTVLKCVSSLRIFEQLALTLENGVCPEIFHCVGYNFYIKDFWATCACPEKQSLSWYFSLHWNIFYLSWSLSNLRLPWKIECALNSLYWIYIFYHSKFWTTCDCPGTQSFPCIFYFNEILFIFQDFWATCACPENRVWPDFYQARGCCRPPPTPASYATGR